MYTYIYMICIMMYAYIMSTRSRCTYVLLMRNNQIRKFTTIYFYILKVKEEVYALTFQPLNLQFDFPVVYLFSTAKFSWRPSLPGLPLGSPG